MDACVQALMNIGGLTETSPIAQIANTLTCTELE